MVFWSPKKKKSKLLYDCIIRRIERIDHSIIDMKETMNKIMSDAEAEQKEQREFRKEQREFVKFVLNK